MRPKGSKNKPNSKALAAPPGAPPSSSNSSLSGLFPFDFGQASSSLLGGQFPSVVNPFFPVPTFFRSGLASQLAQNRPTAAESLLSSSSTPTTLRPAPASLTILVTAKATNHMWLEQGTCVFASGRAVHDEVSVAALNFELGLMAALGAG
ncbi:hypothetical protein BCR44DRAFT_73339 [Catenaria anguillulae PL171]|uniref:Uncharacterized protein n=1 Tax=Catenaria anguillulae PL171 TaxID=765915 RepID=A0A1Y2HQ07_9FUNG|nr:hypothetical protein BCR44DRAFT_73339 [Catenaria anguillulae PL171]